MIDGFKTARNSRLLLAAMLAAAFTLLVASTAAAMTVSATTDRMYVTAATGEANNVSLSFNGSAYVVTDSGATTLVASTGCTKTGSTIYCAKPAVTAINARLRDGDNSLTVGSGVPSALYVLYVTTQSGDNTIDTAALPATAVAGVTTSGGSYQYVTTGPGNDEIDTSSTAQASTINSNLGNDVIVAGGDEPLSVGGSSISTYDGNDIVDTSSMTGGAYVDLGNGHDSLYAGSGDDHVYGSSGLDAVYLGEGNDIFEQSPNTTGAGTIDGGDGDDQTIVWPYAASVDFSGGAGTDDVDYLFPTGSVAISLDGTANDGNPGNANDNIETDVENIGQYLGMSYGDTLVGSAAANTIHGRAGSDTITGGAGTDSLFGENGNDVFYAHDGEIDTIDCGTNTDTVYADVADVVNANCENVTRY